MASIVFDGIKFREQLLKRTSQGTFLPSLVQTGPAVWKENMFKEIVDNARQTTGDSRRTTQDGQQTTHRGPPEKLPLSTLCSGELKTGTKQAQADTVR